MDSLLAEDFIITVEDGGTFSKSGYIAENGRPTLQVEISRNVGSNCSNARQHGCRHWWYHEKGISKGKPYEYHDRTDVWMNINGKWQVIASHYSIPTSQ